MKRIFIFLLWFIAMGLFIPTILLAQIHILTLQPGSSDGMDADIRSNLPTTTNGSSFDFIANAWTAQGLYFDQRSLIRFDLSQIPENSTVVNATLSLCTNLNSGHYQLDSGANASYLLRVLKPWLEQQVTWNNQPVVSFENPIILPQSVSNTQDYIVDVTSHVQNMISDPSTNFGWLFKLQMEEKYRCMVFASSDNPVESWHPKLEITFLYCEPQNANFTFETDTLTVRFTDQSTSADYWDWDFGDGNSSTLQNPVHTYQTPGEYDVCLSVHDSCGSSTYCDTVTVACQAPVAGFSYSISNSNIVSFTDTSVSGNLTSWVWDFGDGNISFEQNPVHEYKDYGIYNACLSITDLCGSDSYCDQIYCLLPMQVIFSTTQSEENDLVVQFHDQTIGSTYWHWTFGDGDSSLAQNPTHVYNHYQLYQVCLTSGNDSMMSTYCDSLNLQLADSDFIENGIILYPNPVPSSTLYFIFSSDYLLANILLSDSRGSIIAEKQVTDIKAGHPLECKLNEIKPGVYVIRVIAGQETKTIKVVFL